MLVFYGVATLFGTPMAGTRRILTNLMSYLMIIVFVFFYTEHDYIGLLYDTLGDYHGAFYLAGSSILLSAFVCYPLGKINHWEKK
jgi:hypothetical protein